MEFVTKLDKLYSLREDFSVIGITGRIGSGCTDIANILQTEFDKLDKVIAASDKSLTAQQRKYKIVYEFNELNWKRYKAIKYKNVLLLIMARDIDYKKFRKHLNSCYVFSHTEKDYEKIALLHSELHQLFSDNETLMIKIEGFGDIINIKGRDELSGLADFFWNEFETFAFSVDEILKKHGVVERTKLLHHTAVNFRKSGQAYDDSNSETFDYIYYIAETINRLIKGTKILFGKCHIVIDSLRNSLEINFFKERYSSFYLIAVKCDERRKKLVETYGEDFKTIDRLLELDDTEYKCNDFVKGHFFSPDVQNCIQKADYHVINQEREIYGEDFDSVQQQLLKLQGLIQQPGLITPSSVERCMQFAYNAKMSSGCISRQVGAVITDSEFSVKSIGWNDVPRGAVPCSLRNIKEIDEEGSFGFSDFELGIGLTEKDTRINIANPDNNDLDKESKDFHTYLTKNYTQEKLDKKELGGINCPYCFKTAYNKFKGESNQVHTRSLHAEENAMMQISKYGGQPLNKGFLFTTASPCELCAKKAYQLGITQIFYIDPYPGISRSHILKQNILANPAMKMFHGAIGRGYLKLYEPFMAQKDEISILTSHSINTPKKVKLKQLKEMFADKVEGNIKLKEHLDKLMEDEDLAFDNVIALIKKGLGMEEN
jgi:deoxycytidylate deaminase